MTTYPQVGDPLNAGVLADGTTVSHLQEHGNLLTLAVNAKKYLRGDGTTESSTQLDLFAAASAGKVGFFPPGTYKFPDGYAGLDVAAATKFYGSGNRSTIITVKDGYGFKTSTAPGNQDRFVVEISDLGVTLRTGCTAGGGINAATWTHGGWLIRQVEVLGVDTNLVPLATISGGTSLYVDLCRFAGNGGDGFYLSSLTYVSNAWTFTRNSVNANCLAGSTYAGLRIGPSGSGGTVSDNVIESNHGYGVYYDGQGGSGLRIEDNWFEGQYNHDVFLTDGMAARIHHNQFEGLAGPKVAGARFIKITDSFGARRNFHSIAHNAFQNAFASSVELGANLSGCSIQFNRGIALHDATISDSGTYTRIEGNDGPDDVQWPLASSRAIITGSTGVFRIKGDTQTGDTGDLSGTALFAVTDTLGEDEFAVTRTGYAAFHTKNGDPGTGLLPTNAFILYWDEATAQIRARFRANGGGTTTMPLGHAASSAYTVTNPTTDRGLNVTGDTTAQVAQVLGTLIADLQAAGILA